VYTSTDLATYGNCASLLSLSIVWSDSVSLNFTFPLLTSISRDLYITTSSGKTITAIVFPVLNYISGKINITAPFRSAIRNVLIPNIFFVQTVGVGGPTHAGLVGEEMTLLTTRLAM
jgi:hypothetical protein